MVAAGDFRQADSDQGHDVADGVETRVTMRLLAPGDEAALDAFLVQYRDTSMFLRSNVRQAGLEYRGQWAGAQYLASFDGGAITGVAAHCWNGILLLQAPMYVDALAKACVETSARAVAGLVGPPDQVDVARAALGLAGVPATADKPEVLYAVDLPRVVVPRALLDGEILCRPPRANERADLHAWGFDYDKETLGAADSADARRRSADFMDARIDAGNAWVAVDRKDALLSFSSFNAALPDIVQLGGIYTPPHLRGRGYAKACVAHSLLIARERGATRAVLFTPNASAARAYEAVGFRRIGDYALILFKEGRP
jgi:GNAT superfamily N-acetyltransferase